MGKQQRDKPWVDEATGTGMLWPPSERAPGCMDAPPLVPTPEAVERWGGWWWYYGGIVQVFERGGRLFAYDFGEEADHCVKGMGPEWAGPVLERPERREG